ncbi:hypothetical protein B0H11DRAFT_2197895 [Mycena galericulata]|nr:hypothetical protein B0H11DRAFT_2197895 [Mycena galericulata]
MAIGGVERDGVHLTSAPGGPMYGIYGAVTSGPLTFFSALRHVNKKQTTGQKLKDSDSYRFDAWFRVNGLRRRVNVYNTQLRHPLGEQFLRLTGPHSGAYLSPPPLLLVLETDAIFEQGVQFLGVGDSAPCSLVVKLDMKVQ